jgi:hypothetical protein
MTLVASVAMAQASETAQLFDIKAQYNISGPLFHSGEQVLGFQVVNPEQVQMIRISLRDQTATQVTDVIGRGEIQKLQGLIRSEMRAESSTQLSAFFNLTKGAGQFLALGEGQVSFSKATVAGLVIADLVTSPLQILIWSVDKATRTLKSNRLESLINLNSNRLVVQLTADQLSSLELATRLSVSSIRSKSCLSATF